MDRPSSSERQLALAFDPEVEPLPSPISGTLKGPGCLREVTAREWRHPDWLSDAEVLAALCLLKNDRNCEGCRKMLLTKFRRRR